MKLKAVLFDLDDTLLENNMDRFLESYFQLLSKYVQAYIDPRVFVSELLVGTQAMIQNKESDMTNKEVFWDVFCQRTGLSREEFEPFINRFYLDDFKKLHSLTRPRPAARRLIELCELDGLAIVIATNPLFPLQAIYHRLTWADVPVAEFDYSLVTSYENMHATKPNNAYYEEILDRIKVSPHEALMAGDHWENDISPASSIGLYTYWVGDNLEPNNEQRSVVTDYGTLDDLYLKLSAEWLIT